MATPAQRTNTWTLDEWYDQAVAGTTGGYVTSGSSHSLFTWGDNFQGVLGLNSANPDRRSSPTQVPGITWSSVSSCYAFNYLALKSDGTLWSWGRNTYGTTGNKSPTQPASGVSSPIQIGTGTDWKMIGCVGAETNAAIKTDGTLWSWGYNSQGQCAQNDATSGYSSPIQIPGTTWNKVNRCKQRSQSRGGAIKTDGTLWMWGRNDSGDLADNTSTQRSSPVQVGTDTNWDDIFSGGYGNFGLKTDGTLWSWGKNTNGVLGLNSGPHNARYSSPTQIGTGTDWKFVDVDVYGRTAWATKTNGTLWAWGYNDMGEMGNNNRTDISSPVQVPGTWAQVAAMNRGVTAIKTDGTLWSWGYAGKGQLGLNQQGNPARRSSPTQVGTDTNWVTESDSSFHRPITGSELTAAALRNL